MFEKCYLIQYNFPSVKLGEKGIRVAFYRPLLLMSRIQNVEAYEAVQDDFQLFIQQK